METFQGPLEISQSQLDSKRTSFRILFGKFVKDIKRFKNVWSNRIIPNCERILLFSSVAQSCPTLCNPMNRSTSDLPVHHHLPEFTQTQHPSSRWCHPAISSSVVLFSSCLQSLPASESFPMSQLFAWGGQSTGVSALASFLPKKSQGWSPLEYLLNLNDNKRLQR